MRTRARQAAKWVTNAYTLPTSRLRSLPDFIIIGAQRAGTTSLYRYLEQHPGIAPAILNKGVHYFDTSYDKDVGWYRAHFPTLAHKARRSRRIGMPVLTGEASPYYLFHPQVPGRVAELLPDVRLIVMLRDPVSRAHSHYQHEVARGFEHLSFEEALEEEEKRLAGEQERLVADETYFSFAHQHYSYVARGLYLEQLQRWYAHFRRDRVHVIVSEEFFVDPALAFRGVLAFLELPAISLPAYAKLNAHAYDPMSERSLAFLTARFAEPNEALARSLGISPRWRS